MEDAVKEEAQTNGENVEMNEADDQNTCEEQQGTVEPMSTSGENGDSGAPNDTEEPENSNDAGNTDTKQEEENKIDSDTTDDRKLFVGGLSWQTQNSDLREHFQKYGEVIQVSIKTDPVTGNSRGFGFVVFKESNALDLVLAEKAHTINGKVVDPKKAKARPKPKKVFVGGLDPSVAEEEVKAYFGKFGEIEESEFPVDKIKNQRRQFCFITFKTSEAALKACDDPKQTIGPKECDVKLATPKDQAQGVGGGFGRGGRGGPMARGGFGRGNRGSSFGGRGGGAGVGGWGSQGYGGYGAYGSSYGNYDLGGYGGSGYGQGYDYGAYYGNYGGYGTGYDYGAAGGSWYGGSNQNYGKRKKM